MAEPAARQKLMKLTELVLAEMESNPGFAEKIGALLGEPSPEKKAAKKTSQKRSPSRIHPYEIAKKGARALEDALNGLDVEELKDTIQQYDMDTTGKAMRLRKKEALIDHILLVAERRGKKGDVFMGPGT